jgi:hypothetical protein
VVDTPTPVVVCCQLCASKGVRTRLIQNQQAHPFCPKCDRLQCGQCRTPIVDPKAKTCPNGHPVGRPVELPPE